MSMGVRVRSWKSALEVRVIVSTIRLRVEACLPKGSRGERRELVASLGLYYEEGCWPTIHKVVRTWSRFPDEPEAWRNQLTWSMKMEV